MPYDRFSPIVDLLHESLTVQAVRSSRFPGLPSRVVVGPSNEDLNACIDHGSALVMELDSFADLVRAGTRFLRRDAEAAA